MAHSLGLKRALVFLVTIAMVTVVFATVPVAGGRATAGAILPAGPSGSRDVLLRGGSPADRQILTFVGASVKVDYGDFVLASVSGGGLADLTSKGLVLRDLSDRTMILLGSAQFDTRNGEPSVASDLRVSGYAPGIRGLYLLQFVGPIKPDWVTFAKSLDIQFYNYIPNFAFIVAMTPETASSVAAFSYVQWVGIYQPAYKISHLVYEQLPAADALASRMPMPVPSKASGASPRLSATPSATALRSGSGAPMSSLSLGRTSAGTYDLSVLVLKTAPSFTWASLASLALRKYQTMDAGATMLLRFSTDASNLARIANLPGVYWMEPYLRPTLSDEVSSQIVAGNIDPITPGYYSWLGSVGLTGAGVTVAVDDTGVDTGVDNLNVTGDMHPELDNRVVANLYYGYLTDASDGYGHGTHTSGLVAGNGATNLTDPNGYLYGLGIAPSAHIVNQRIFDSSGGWVAPNYTELAMDAYNHGASINSNSWGISDFGQYLIDDAMYDALVRDADPTTPGNQQLTFEFSAGNAGSGSQSIGSAGNAKNTITTGASLNYRPDVQQPGTWPADNIDAIVGFSSRGPTADGRIKPDLVTPGTWVSSLLSSASVPGWCGWENIDQYHEYCGGTSMSGPMVSGGAALFVEYYRNLNAADPSPALTKAALVNGAVDMPPTSASAGSSSTGPIPNFDEGWGRMDLGNVVAFPGTIFYDDQVHALNTGDSYSYQLAVGLTTAPFKVSLAWTDVPGIPGAGTELVNDLDLVVTAPDGTTYLGNYLLNGTSVPGGVPDTKNNLENVYIASTEVQIGLYTVTVLGVNVPSGPQDFALVVSYAGGPTANGVVQFDNTVYNSSAAAGVILMDTDLNLNPNAPDTATVSVDSDQLDNETVVLTEVGDNSAVFVGSVQLTLNPSGFDDGVLTVVNGGQIWILYVEVSPPGLRIAYATIDDTPPIITNVAVSGVTHKGAEISWTTDEASTTEVLYGVTTPPSEVAIGSRGTSHSVSLSGLSANTTYFFEVESTDAAGNTATDNNGGAWYTFTTLPVPPVLLVDEDYTYTYETYYENALTALGYTFDYWDINILGSPSLGDLEGYPVVLWYIPFGAPGSAEQATLSQFLDDGGRLVIGGQDIGYSAGYTSWYGTYLHAVYLQDNAPTRNIVGVPGDPIGDGLAMSITGGDGASNNYYPDVIDPIAPAVTGVQYDSGVNTRTSILHVDTGVYQVAYMAFNFESISTEADRDLLMDRLISWIFPPAYGVFMTPGEQSGIAVPGQTLDYAMTVKNRGVALTEDTFDMNWTALPLGWTVALLHEDLSPFADTNGDGVVDTGPIASGATMAMILRVSVDPAAVGGDQDTVTLTANSVVDSFAIDTAIITTLVPSPGVSIPTGPYEAITPDMTVVEDMTIHNDGGMTDVLNLAASSMNGWEVTLLAADGVTPLTDTNGDGLVDVGSVAGLTAVNFAVQIVVPAGIPRNTIDVTTVTGSSAADPTATADGSIVLEYYGPGPSDWPTFHNSEMRRGASPNVFEPPLTALWTAGPYTQSLWTSPVYADGMLASTTLDGYIRARDPFTGSVVWSRMLGDQYYYTGTPTVTGGVLYTVFGGAAGDTLYALDMATGATVWSQNYGTSGIDFNARLALAAADGMVFGGAWTGQIWALDAATGDVLWTYGTGMYPWGGPTVAAGMVWMPVLNPNTGAGYLFALDEATGDLVWSRALDNTATSPPLFAQGNIYEGTYAGTMYALSAFTGDIVWATPGFYQIDFSTPAYDGTNLYFGTFDGRYVALDATTGTPLWVTSIGSSIGSSMAYANGYLYATAWTSYFFVLEASTGFIVEAAGLQSYASTSSPAIGNGVVWFEDINGFLYAYGAPGVGIPTAMGIVPGSVSLSVGGAVLLRAQAYDVYSNPVPGGPFDWESLGSLGTILPLSPNGDQVVYIAGATAGTETVQATMGLMLGEADVTITPGSLDRIDVSPGEVTIAAGGTYQFADVAFDRFGNPISGVTCAWSTLGGIGTVSSTGLFTAGHSLGVGTVSAASGGVSGTAVVAIAAGPAASLAVSPATLGVAVGDVRILTASAVDAFGNAVSGGTFTWSATGGTVASLVADGSMVQYIAPATVGDETLTASMGGHTATVAVSVAPGPAASLVVTAATSSVAAGGTVALTATAYDLYGNAVTGGTAAWTSTGGSVSASGVLTAPTTVGFVTVTATLAGKQGSLSLQVIPAALDRLETSLSTLAVNTYGGAALTVVGKDAYGNELSGLTYTWSTSIGTVQAVGNGQSATFLAGGSGGSGQITVTSGGKTSTVDVTVTAVAPALSLGDQMVQGTSVVFLVAFIAAILAALFFFVKWRQAGKAAKVPPPPEDRPGP